MAKGIFITATGTDVGKTFVSALLVKKFKDLGFDCGYYKPVLSGAEIHNGELIPGDCAYVKEVAGLKEKANDLVSYAFKPAVSPHLASQIENTPIKLDKIIDDYKSKKANHEITIVEGAGGIVCPISLTDNETILLEDIIKALELDVIILAPALLGSINSAVLTVEYAKNHGIDVKGIILNHYDENDFMCKDNKLQIERLTGVPVIAVVKDKDKELFIEKNNLMRIFD